MISNFSYHIITRSWCSSLKRTQRSSRSFRWSNRIRLIRHLWTNSKCSKVMFNGRMWMNPFLLMSWRWSLWKMGISWDNLQSRSKLIMIFRWANSNTIKSRLPVIHLTAKLNRNWFMKRLLKIRSLYSHHMRHCFLIKRGLVKSLFIPSID